MKYRHYKAKICTGALMGVLLLFNYVHSQTNTVIFAMESGSVAGRLASSPQSEQQEIIEEVLEEAFGINVYPNPVSNLLNIRIGLQKEERVIVEIYNMSGRRVYFSNPSSLGKGNLNLIIDAGKFQPGLYSIKVETESSVLSKTFIVAR